MIILLRPPNAEYICKYARAHDVFELETIRLGTGKENRKSSSQGSRLTTMLTREKHDYDATMTLREK